MFRLRRRVYLDNNATTEITARVRTRMCAVLRQCYGNPSSPYRVARDAAALLAQARETVARVVGAMPEEIVFTGSASEANNQILKSFLACAQAGRNKIVSTPIEHSSVTATLEYLRDAGMVVVFCPVDRAGRVVSEELEALVDAKTALVCCLLANNETGVVQDLARVVEVARRHGARVMADCVQALGKIPVDIKMLGVDYASFSAHKIHGPKGVGALYVRQGSPLTALIHGGHQEDGRRAGTESLHNIVGLAEACRNVPEFLERAPAVAELKDLLIREIRRIKPDVTLNSPEEGGLANTASITFPGFDNGELIAFLDYHGVAVSAGSACNTEANEASHVLTAIGLSTQAARQTLRFSLSTETTRREIRYAVGVLRDILQRRALPVAAVNPAQLDANMLFDENLFVIDIRHGYDRRLLKGLPNSHEVSAVLLRKSLNAIPREKKLLLVCQTGFDSPIAAYYLRSKGYKDVGFVLGGIVGWKLLQPELYGKFGDMNKAPLRTDAP